MAMVTGCAVTPAKRLRSQARGKLAERAHVDLAALLVEVREQGLVGLRGDRRVVTPDPVKAKYHPRAAIFRAFRQRDQLGRVAGRERGRHVAQVDAGLYQAR